VLGFRNGRTKIACSPLSPVSSEKLTRSPTDKPSKPPAERFDYAVRRHLMGLDAPVLLAEHIFELTVRGTEGVVDRYLHIVMAFANTRIVADVNVRASRHRQMDAYLIRSPA
jgi:hypothetical protein